MLVVKIELWPGGDKSRCKTLATSKIINDASGDAGCGNYTVELRDAGTFSIWR